MKKYIILLLLFFLHSSQLGMAQNMVVTEEGDTIVTLTLDQVKVINCVFSDYTYLLVDSEIQDSMLLYQKRNEVDLRNRIKHSDSIISSQYRLIEFRDGQIQDRDEEIELKTKQIRWAALGSFTFGVVLTLLAGLL